MTDRIFNGPLSLKDAIIVASAVSEGGGSWGRQGWFTALGVNRAKGSGPRISNRDLDRLVAEGKLIRHVGAPVNWYHLPE